MGLVLLTTALAQARETNNVAIASYAQNFVARQGDSLVRFKPGKFLSAPYTVLYFGAGWCPDCRRFSPALAGVYKLFSKKCRIVRQDGRFIDIGAYVLNALIAA